MPAPGVVARSLTTEEAGGVAEPWSLDEQLDESF